MTSGPSAPPPKVAQKPPVETTGTATPRNVEPVQFPAPVKTDTASVSDCARQTWPYITQQCLTEREAAQRKVRVITTDRIAPPVVSAIERETVNVAPATKPAAPAPAPVVAIAPAPAPETKAAPVIDRPAPVATPVVPPMVAPTPQTAATTEQRPQTATTQQPPKAAANDKRGKSARDARTREAKSRRAPVRDSDDDDDVADYSPRSRVVERWTEREYMVPSEESSQRRRVIVIRRGGDPNPFGSLFSSAFR